MQNIRKHIGGDTVTLADLAGHRATLLQGPRFVGTGPEVADQMEEWFNTDACDGFVIAATHSPGAYEDVVRLVVPELQRRGAFRDRYTGDDAARPPRPCTPRHRPRRSSAGLRAAGTELTPVGEPRARRSELATPASSERMCEKAASSGADLVFLDLEDACAPVVKESARAIAVAALTNLDWGRTVRAVRVNGLETPWCYGDIIEVVSGARESLDVLIVPKARSARDVWWVDVLLTQLETKLGLSQAASALEVLIEEAEGLANAAEIARGSDRLEAIIFGAGDLSASLRARVDGNFDPVGEYPGDFWHYARFQVLAAARAPASTRSTLRIRPTRTPTDTAGRPFTPACWASTASGRSTRTRSPIANEVFAPTADEVEEAEQAIETYRSAEADGVGAIGRDGKLVDAAHMRLAENVLHKASLAREREDRQ